MEQKNERPPNYDKIVAAIPSVVDYPNAYFCYGDTIYNPGECFITREKIAHEAVHALEQAGVGIDWWWARYLEDTSFRFKEEAAAYKKEYEVFCKWHKDRNQRNLYLNQIAAELAAEPYGSKVSVDDAKAIIKGTLVWLE